MPSQKPVRLTTALSSREDVGVPLASAIEEFLGYHRRKGSSKSYQRLIDYYLGDRQKTQGSMFRPLLRWATDEGYRTLPQLDRSVCRLWLDEIESKLSLDGLHKSTEFLRRLLAFCVEEGLIKEMPLKLSRVKLPEKQIQVYTNEEVLTMSRFVSKEHPRDWAIFVLLVDTGIRASELIGLQMQDVYWDRREILVHGKGNRERIVPFVSTTLSALNKYRRLRPDTDQTDAFFLSFAAGRGPTYSGGKGKVKRQSSKSCAFAPAPLTRVGLFHLVKKWGKLAGITDARCSPHTFRHYFAVQYLRGSRDIVSLQKILGHSKLETTLMYAKLADVDVKRFHSSFSPALALVPARQRPLDVAS